MSPLVRKGLWVAAIHVALAASLGGKLLLDRATRPRVWARTAPVDPNLPIRGRYVRLRLEAVPDDRLALSSSPAQVDLVERDGHLVARPGSDSDRLTARRIDRAGQEVVVIDQPVAYFIPEHVPDPSRRAEGEELWVEVTIPRRGAPRPIRLGVKKDGVLKPLELN